MLCAAAPLRHEDVGSRPKTHRSARRAKKRIPKKSYQQIDQERRRTELDRKRHRQLLDLEKERAEFAKFPRSIYPATKLVHRSLSPMRDIMPRRMSSSVSTSAVIAEMQVIWLRAFRRWQKVRERFLRFHGRTPEDRKVIQEHSLFYLDQRAWELRKVGYSVNQPEIWEWWKRRSAEERMWFIHHSRDKYADNRKSWRKG